MIPFFDFPCNLINYIIKFIFLLITYIKFFNSRRSNTLVCASSKASSSLDASELVGLVFNAGPALPLSPSGPVGAGVVDWVVTGSRVEGVTFAVNTSDAVETSSESVAHSRATDTATARPGAPWKPEWLGTRLSLWRSWLGIVGTAGPPLIRVHCRGRSQKKRHRFDHC